MRQAYWAGLLVGLCGALAMAAGCSSSEPHYARPLPPGTFGLERITDPSELPDLEPVAQQLGESSFQQALARSLSWYEKPSSQLHFPLHDRISHTHVHTSAYALREIGEHDFSTALQMLRNEFDVWRSVGWDGSGEVLFTGYYSPIFRASRTPQGPFQYPVHTRPDDLEIDPVTGEVHGRRTEHGGLEPYPTREQIESENLLAGNELVYFASRLDAYLVHVNGSARLQMAQGDVMHIGYAGSNGYDYTSIGRMLVEEGHYAEHEMSLNTIRDHFRENPGQLDRYLQANDRYIFFGEYEPDSWPAGSLGVRVTPMRTLATDNAIFPRGAVVFVDTQIPSRRGGTRSFQQLMVDQDTGGAIRAPGRGDIYIGVGEQAGEIAGRQAAEGRMYYLLLRPERVRYWYDRMRDEQRELAAAER